MRFISKLILSCSVFVVFAYVVSHAGSIEGRQNIKSPSEQFQRAIYSQASDTYDYAEFQVAGVTDYDVASNQNMFQSTGTPRAHNLNIRTDANIKIRVSNAFQSSTTAKQISIASTESPFHWSGMETGNLWITCASTCNVKVLAW
jgi:hypothetical protein